MPMAAIVMILAVPRKLFTRVDKGGNSYSNQYLYVKSPEGKCIAVPFHPSKKVGEVKRELECKLNLNLILEGYSLCVHLWKRLDKNNLSLSDYGVTNGSTLVVNVPMRAGTKEMSKTEAGVGVSKAVKLTGRWTAEEHRLFLRGLEQHGKDYERIAVLVRSRTKQQCKTHGQKHFQKLAKKEAPPPQLLDPFYQARANELEGTAPGPNCHVPDWRRKRGEREQESKEAKKARRETRLSKKIEEAEQETQKQNRQRLAQAKEKDLFGKSVVQSARESAREEVKRRREEQDEFYRWRQEKALGEAHPPEPKRSKHYAEANRKRAEREQESEEANATRLEKERQRTSRYREQETEEEKEARLERERRGRNQRYHDENAKAREVEFYDNGVPKLCESVDIDGPVEKARELICRTAIGGDINKHQANVCVTCDRIIQLGAEVLKQISEHQIKEFTDQLSVDSYNEFHGELHPEVVKQYQVEGLEGLLLSPRSRRTELENGDVVYEVCSQCYNGMKSGDEERECPTRHAISNGFAIGSIPTKFVVEINGKEETFKVGDEMITALISAAIAPVRPHAWIFSYTGGQSKKIRGNYQFFEADLSRMGGVFSYLNEVHCDQILCVLSGAMTPKQKDIARQQAEIDTKLFLGLLTWFVKHSGHPGFKNVPVPSECPRPIIIEDPASEHNTDEPSPGEKGQKREETFEEGTCYFPTAGDPDSNTNVFKTSQEFAMSLLEGRSGPTLIASGGNYAGHSEILLENVRPIQFPFGHGGPYINRRNKISVEECFKHYLDLSPPQFMRPEFVLLIRAMRDRWGAYNAARLQCNNITSHVDGDGKKMKLADVISRMTEEELKAAMEEEQGRETGVAGCFLKAVSASCRALGHTAAAAKQARRKNLAMQDYFGRHSFMLTVSPCVEGSFRIRLYAATGEEVSLFAPLGIV